MNKYREHSIQISEDTSPTDQEGAAAYQIDIRCRSRGRISSVAPVILL